jgi:hypothetical protein
MTERILNLTQHDATGEQLAAGVIEPTFGNDKKVIQELLTIETLAEAQSLKELLVRAQVLAEFARDYGCGQAMIGGAGYLMQVLTWALAERGITPLYAFSQREKDEVIQPDGSVRTVSIFRHKGFVPAPNWNLKNENQKSEETGS